MIFGSFIDWFISEKLKANGDDYSRAKVLIGFALSLAIAVLVYSTVYFYFRQTTGGVIICIAGFAFFFSALLVKYFGNLDVAANFMVGSFWFTISSISFLGGGVMALSSPWFAAVALSGILIAGVRSGIFWSLLSTLALVVFFVLKLNHYQFSTMGLSELETETFYFIGVSGLALIITAFGLVFSIMIGKMVIKTKESSQLVEQNMTQLKEMITDLEQIMAGISAGDFSKKLEMDGTNKEIDLLKTRLNGPLTMLVGIISKVVEVSSKVNTGSRDLSQSAQSLSSGSSEQAASLEEISSSLVEVGKQAMKNNESSEEACLLIDRMVTSVSESNKIMADLLNSMNEINQTSSKVTGVIKTIDEIAFQTNLLALNAAVEAARAGKYGKGFAVVAEEVRNLASRSSKAAKSTTDLIGSSAKEVEEGLKKSSLTAESFKVISEGVEKVNSIIQNIAVLSAQQSNGIREINNGLGQVNLVVQSNTAIAEQTASTADELLNQADELENIVASFSGGVSSI